MEDYLQCTRCLKKKVRVLLSYFHGPILLRFPFIFDIFQILIVLAVENCLRMYHLDQNSIRDHKLILVKDFENILIFISSVEL